MEFKQNLWDSSGTAPRNNVLKVLQLSPQPQCMTGAVGGDLSS